MELLMMSVILGLAVACHMMRARLKRLEGRIMQNELDVAGYRRHLTAGIQQNGVSIGKLNERVPMILKKRLEVVEEEVVGLLNLVTGMDARASAQTLTIEVGDAECDHLLESRTLTVEVDDTERQ